jgi:arabinofuranosyltransferase
MGGRFFALPFLISAWILLDNYSFKGWFFRYVWPAAVVILFLFAPLSPVRQGSDYTASSLISTKGIVDEKGFYYSMSGLLLYNPGEMYPSGQTVQDGIDLRNSDAKVGIEQGVGYYGYFAGPEKYIIDELALSDALLSRITVHCWRPGHCYRVLPAGYRESVENQTNKIVDEKLASFYEKIRLVTMGELFSRERFSAILELNFSRKAYDQIYPADLEYYKIKFEKEPGIKELLNASVPSDKVLFQWVRPDLFP